MFSLRRRPLLFASTAVLVLICSGGVAMAAKLVWRSSPPRTLLSSMAAAAAKQTLQQIDITETESAQSVTVSSGATASRSAHTKLDNRPLHLTLTRDNADGYTELTLAGEPLLLDISGQSYVNTGKCWDAGNADVTGLPSNLFAKLVAELEAHRGHFAVRHGKSLNTVRFQLRYVSNSVGEVKQFQTTTGELVINRTTDLPVLLSEVSTAKAVHTTHVSISATHEQERVTFSFPATLTELPAPTNLCTSSTTTTTTSTTVTGTATAVTTTPTTKTSTVVSR